MALHSDAARALSQSFENQATHKVYIAMVRGWAPPAVEVDHPCAPTMPHLTPPCKAPTPGFARWRS